MTDHDHLFNETCPLCKKPGHDPRGAVVEYIASYKDKITEVGERMLELIEVNIDKDDTDTVIKAAELATTALLDFLLLSQMTEQGHAALNVIANMKAREAGMR